jgi:hypothetical protein
MNGPPCRESHDAQASIALSRSPSAGDPHRLIDEVTSVWLITHLTDRNTFVSPDVNNRELQAWEAPTFYISRNG